MDHGIDFVPVAFLRLEQHKHQVGTRREMWRVVAHHKGGKILGGLLHAGLQHLHGIGADGVIFLNTDQDHDFQMVYHNSDGSQSFCGNGCRAIVHLANHLGVIKNKASFTAHDGSHQALILPDERIRISLADVKSIEQKAENDFYINTGTEHHVRLVTGLQEYPVVEEGRKIRYSETYKPGGTNANFVEVGKDAKVSFRIYERGVEDETYSSGSGATACALVAAHKFSLKSPISLAARGGNLLVEFKTGQEGKFSDIFFTGPVQLVFETTFQA